MFTLLLFCLAVLVLYQGETLTEASTCRDTYGRYYCTKNRCPLPGFADHCKETCDICAGEGCKERQFISKGECVPCADVPPELTASYNSSCGLPCPSGYWEFECNNTCSIGCKTNACKKWTGYCVRGCKRCYTGRRCTLSENCDCSGSRCSCKPGYTGSNCEQPCPPNCLKKICTGDRECSHGCGREWYGKRCDKQCSNCFNETCSLVDGICTQGCKEGFYDEKCSSKCSDSCVDKGCNHTDGTCYLCNQGLFGSKCEKPCPVNCTSESCSRKDGTCLSCKAGFAGPHCNILCPGICNRPECNQHDGSCTGCKVGFRGSHCNMSCPSECILCDQYVDKCSSCNHGWYGQLCNKTCKTCRERICNSTDGICVYGCQDGYHGVFCRNPCNIYCQVKNGSLRCNTNDGICADGCKDGWFGDTCEKECNSGCIRCHRESEECTSGCKNGLYGTYCNNHCSDNCNNKTCHVRNDSGNPVCTLGCTDGWWGEHCQLPCPRNSIRCDRSSGSCLECKRNRYGAYCNETCSRQCSKSVCKQSGICTFGCEDGFWNDYCNQTCPRYCLRCDRSFGFCLQCDKFLYGANCDMNCSRWCRRSECNMTGFCTGGCQDGRHGKTCEDSCGARCRVCDQLTAACVTCVGGWTGQTCDDSVTKALKSVVWGLSTTVCLLVSIVIILCINRRRISQYTSQAFRGLYISAVTEDQTSPEQECDLPMQDVRQSRHSDNSEYAVIPDYE